MDEAAYMQEEERINEECIEEEARVKEEKCIMKRIKDEKAFQNADVTVESGEHDEVCIVLPNIAS